VRATYESSSNAGQRRHRSSASEEAGPRIWPHVSGSHRRNWRLELAQGLDLRNHRRGFSARETGRGPRSIRKWLTFSGPTEGRAAPSKPCSPSYFGNYLSRRWAEGCVRGRELFLKIKLCGYTGSFSHMKRLLAKWRTPIKGRAPHLLIRFRLPGSLRRTQLRRFPRPSIPGRAGSSLRSSRRRSASSRRSRSHHMRLGGLRAEAG